MTAPSPLVLGSELPGRPIVAIDCGDDIAEVKDVVFDPVSHQLVGFTLNKRGWFRGTLKATLPADRVRAIGPDAVMIDRNSDLIDLSDTPEELDTSSGAVSVIGSRVLSASGDELGSITDIILDTGAAPRAAGYQVAGDEGTVFVPISAQISLSEETLVLPASAAEFVRNDLAGVGAAVTNYRKTLEV